jgi:DNA-directed RNA polymerase specialized sigma24 family protein
VPNLWIVDWPQSGFKDCKFEEWFMSVTKTSSSLQNTPDGDFALFDARFWRCYQLLHFIACRILNDPEQAKKAVDNCWHSASVRVPRFEYEGAFRSWLARVLIDEALLLLLEKQQALETNIALEQSSPLRNCINVADRNA